MGIESLTYKQGRREAIFFGGGGCWLYIYLIKPKFYLKFLTSKGINGRQWKFLMLTLTLSLYFVNYINELTVIDT